MRTVLFSILCFLQGTVFVDLGWAASEHEMYVGAQKEQICSGPIIHIIGKFLGVKAFKVPAEGYSPNADAIIVAAACKPSPADKRVMITAIAYESDTEYIKRFIVAFVDERERKVLSSLQSEIGEDAAMRVESGSLWIDTAPYRLSDKVRAFGVDVTSGYIPNCGDGGLGAERTLYVREGNVLRPVLTATMSYWRFVKGGNPRCMAIDQEPPETVIESIDLAIGLDSGETNGYRDLVVTAISSRDDGKPTGRGVFRYKLHYDGRNYPTKELMDQFYKWD